MRNFDLRQCRLFVVIVLSFLVGCEHLPNPSSFAKKSKKVRSQDTSEAGVISTEVRGPNDDEFGEMIIQEEYHFTSSGFDGSLLKVGAYGNQAILKLENRSNELGENIQNVTLKIDFNIPIRKNVRFFQVAYGVDSIVESIGYGNNSLLIEFQLSPEEGGEALANFKFGMLIHSLKGAALPPLEQLIMSIDLFPGNIETVILDEFFTVEQHAGNRTAGGGEFRPVNHGNDSGTDNAKNLYNPWLDIMGLINMYQGGGSLDLIENQASQTHLNCKEILDVKFHRFKENMN